MDVDSWVSLNKFIFTFVITNWLKESFAKYSLYSQIRNELLEYVEENVDRMEAVSLIYYYVENAYNVSFTAYSKNVKTPFIN